MAKLSLLGGAYTSRSVIADAQRCVNLYPEINPQDAEQPVSHLLTPGLTLLIPGASTTIGPVRGLYFSSNNQLYAVIGSIVYYISASWTATALGRVSSALTPVGMKDNGITLTIVDGTAAGYQVDLVTNVFSPITDPNFLGSTRADYVDTFLLYNQPGTRNFYCSLSNEVVFDPLYIAGKVAAPDLLVAVIAVHREIWLIGERTSEPWYNAGNPNFPFALLPGVIVQYGCAAKYSIAQDGLNLFWLHQDINGQGLVLMGEGYNAKPITTPAVAEAISTYPIISDAVGFCYQQGSHVFYQISFPSADKTWVYDKTTQLWHERSWRDSDGNEHRSRANCHAIAYGKNVIGDWQNGNLYYYDLTSANDNGVSVVRRRGFPHIVTDGKRSIHTRFVADIECGTIVNVPSIVPGDFSSLGDFQPGDFSTSAPPGTFAGPTVNLRWSDDRGHTWKNPIQLPIGASGQYAHQAIARGLGKTRDRIYEIFWDGDEMTAIQGAYLDIKPCGQ